VHRPVTKFDKELKKLEGNSLADVEVLKIDNPTRTRTDGLGIILEAMFPRC